MEEVLAHVFSNLGSYFSEHRVVYEQEIREAIHIEIGRLDKKTKVGLGKYLDSDPEEAIFQSIVHEPLSVFSPTLAVRDYMGESFYTPHVHRSFMDELEEAFARLMKSRAKEILPKMEAVTRNFLSKSGYTVSDSTDRDEPIKLKEMTAVKGGDSINLYILPSIAYAQECPESAQVIAVPTEKTPIPFIRFQREQQLKGKNIQVWVMDPDRETVSPFLGSSSDGELAKNFDNPELAEMTAKHYRSVGSIPARKITRKAK